MLHIILFGAPGAGKGTQATQLATSFELKHVSTGDLLRTEIKNQTLLGLQAKPLVDAGTLVPDEIVIGMIENLLSHLVGYKGVIFDGFPRTLPQAEALDALLQKLNQPIKSVLTLDVPEKELTKRLLLRGETSNRPDDKDESIIQHRFQQYEQKTGILKEYYLKQNKLKSVDGTRSIENITADLKSICNSLA